MMEKFNYDKDMIKSKQDEIKAKLEEQAPDMEAIKKALDLFSSVQSGDIFGAFEKYNKNQDMFSSLAEKSKLNRTDDKRLTLQEADAQYKFTQGEVLDYFNNLTDDMKKLLLASTTNT